MKNKSTKTIDGLARHAGAMEEERRKCLANWDVIEAKKLLGLAMMSPSVKEVREIIEKLEE